MDLDLGNLKVAINEILMVCEKNMDIWISTQNTYHLLLDHKEIHINLIKMVCLVIQNMNHLLGYMEERDRFE